MKPCLATAALLLAAAIASPQEESKNDLKEMEGTWKAVLHEKDGKKTSAEEREKFDVKLVVKDGKYTVSFDGKQIGAGVVKLNATKKPKEVDAVATEGPGKDMAMKGIYELKDDAMRVCFAEPGKERPTEFRTKEGSGQILISYKRLKP